MARASVLWQLLGFGEELHPFGQNYWWVNRQRGVSASVVQYTLKGALRYLQDGRETLVRQGEACLFNYDDGSEYGVRPNDMSYTCFWISLSGAGIPEHWNQMRESHGPVVVDSNDRFLKLLRGIVKTGSSYKEQDAYRAANAIHDFVMRFMALLDRRSNQFSSPVDRAVNRVCGNPFFPWSFKELVAEEGCSLKHFFRVFRERHATTPAAWLRQRRAEQALHLLRATRLTVGDIALQCGFSGAHSLSRTLRDIYQQGPTALRSSIDSSDAP